MIKIQEYKGVSIYEKKDLRGGKYYFSPDLTTNKVSVNFSPHIRELKKFIDTEKDNKNCSVCGVNEGKGGTNQCDACLMNVIM